VLVKVDINPTDLQDSMVEIVVDTVVVEVVTDKEEDMVEAGT